MIQKRITRDTSPSTILNAFQKQDMAPDEWQPLADQVPTRGFQQTAEVIQNSKDTLAEEHVTGGISSPPRFSDESMIDEQSRTTIRHSKKTTKNQGPKSFGSPIKHSVREISAEANLADLNEMALEKYRYKLTNLKTDTRKPLETRLNLLERHFFRKSSDILQGTHRGHGMQRGKNH